MSSSAKAKIEAKRDNLIAKLQEIRDTKNADAKTKYEEILEKAQAIYDKQTTSAQEKYDEFIAKVEDDTSKRLKIVNKVIDAEAEERIYKEDQIKRQKESEEREAAEVRLREQAEKQRHDQEEKEKRIAAKKAAKKKKKEMALRNKVPIPQGFVSIKDSKKLVAKLKRISSAGRYGFCCFSGKGHKKFRAHCQELCDEFNTNVAWYDCTIKDMNFEQSMLLYEFNATPAVVVCFEGDPSNLHRYVIGFTDDSKATLRRYAEKADAA